MQAKPADPSYELTVEVGNVSNAKGEVGALVFASETGWPDQTSAAIQSGAVASQAGMVTLIFSGLPAGEYGVVVLHDENGNMKMDRNWLGIPKEQWGMSNNPAAVLSAPGFEKARFALRSDQRIEVRLRK